MVDSCFNPCLNGRGTSTFCISEIIMIDYVVSILVLMEGGLQQLIAICDYKIAIAFQSLS